MPAPAEGLPSRTPSGSAMGPAQWIFLASVVALDFAFGMVAKPLMHATGLGAWLKLEMVFPAMLWALSRLTLDRFGTCTVYQLTWGCVATVLMPMAVLPGPLKLIPMGLQGLLLDSVYSGGRRLGQARVLLAAFLASLVGNATTILVRVYLGWPWAKATQVFFGLETLAAVAVHLTGAVLALAVWRRVRDLQALRLIQVQP